MTDDLIDYLYHSLNLVFRRCLVKDLQVYIILSKILLFLYFLNYILSPC